jgi:hypothetical protein
MPDAESTHLWWPGRSSTVATSAYSHVPRVAMTRSGSTTSTGLRDDHDLQTPTRALLQRGASATLVKFPRTQNIIRPHRQTISVGPRPDQHSLRPSKTNEYDCIVHNVEAYGCTSARPRRVVAVSAEPNHLPRRRGTDVPL